MTLIAGDKVVSVQTKTGIVVVPVGSLVPGGKIVTIQTTTGPVAVPANPTSVGDKCLMVPDKRGKYIALKYGGGSVGAVGYGQVVRWSSDSARLAFSYSSGCRVYTVSGNVLTLEWECPDLAGAAHVAEFSPDCNYLAIGMESGTTHIYVYKRVGAVYTKLTVANTLGFCCGLAWSNDGTKLYASDQIYNPGSGSIIQIYSVSGITVTKTGTITVPGGVPVALQMSPDENWLFASVALTDMWGLAYWVSVFKNTGGVYTYYQIVISPQYQHYIQSIDCSMDSLGVMFGYGTTAMYSYILNGATWEASTLPVDLATPVSNYHLSPYADKVVINHNDICRFYTYYASGMIARTSRRVLTNSLRVNSIRWSPDMTRIAYCHNDGTTTPIVETAP